MPPRDETHLKADHPTRDEIGDGACNGILLGLAGSFLLLISTGAVLSGLDLAVGDGLTRTLAAIGMFLVPALVVIGGVWGGIRVYTR